MLAARGMGYHPKLLLIWRPHCQPWVLSTIGVFWTDARQFSRAENCLQDRGCMVITSMFLHISLSSKN
jgi:hypothetical protein